MKSKIRQEFDRQTVNEKACELLEDIIDHGFGEIRVEAKKTKNNTVEVVLTSGRKYRYLVRKNQNNG